MRELIDRNNVITSIVKSLGIRSIDYLLPAEKDIVKVIQEEPTVCDIDAIRDEIEQNAYPIVHGVNNHEKGMTLYGILQIIDKHTRGIRNENDSDI